LIKLLVLTASLLVAFGLSELMVRIIEPQQLILKRPDVWRTADSLGWTHRAGVNTTINTGERTVHLYTDRDGYRVGATGRVDAPVRILVLGDSFLEALQVEYEESVAGLLEDRLPRRLETPVAVRNAAVDGWDPRQYFIKARSALSEEDFDLALVFLYLGNDVISDSTYYLGPRRPKEVHPFRLPRSLAKREVTNAIFYPINDVLEVRSHLFILFKKRFDAVLMRLGLTAAYFPNGFQKSEVDSPAWNVTAHMSRDIASLGDAVGIPVLFVLLPVPIQIEPELFKRYASAFDIDPEQVDLEQPNRLMAAALEELGLDFIDALPLLREAHGRGEKVYGEVDRHLSVRGHQVVEGLVEEWVGDYLADRVPPEESPRRDAG
jgi:hypothetical protein